MGFAHRLTDQRSPVFLAVIAVVAIAIAIVALGVISVSAAFIDGRPIVEQRYARPVLRSARERALAVRKRELTAHR